MNSDITYGTFCSESVQVVIIHI